ncbi:DUF3325 domain-containing protein [uncultured Xylophilus sp.]|uniref:DUF3325 domain-containing protein n=1 Tax=uncultured Xylophilus sp. TaxID=296832 RepID=UPI0025E7C9BB|nr:DUF3325 domain-containing protein [uncultured Xylophilus sp.]
MSATVLWMAGAFASALGGFSALGLAMDRHFEDGFGRGRTSDRARPWLRVAGGLGLLSSLLACCVLRGSAQGWVLWFGMLTASAVAVVLVMSYAPRQSARVLVAAGAVAVLTLAAGCWRWDGCY